MTIQESIEKSIEGGWDWNDYRVWHEYTKGPPTKHWLENELWKDIYQIVLDPNWWQSLGKAMGWECKKQHYHFTTQTGCSIWLQKWHRLIDHLAEGKYIESYFKTL